jgi:hypothetical protein
LLPLERKDVGSIADFVFYYSYFLNIHPILPIINKTEFLKQYRDQIGTYPSGELLNAMFGAAARFVECERLDPERMKNIADDAVWDIHVGWSDHFFDQADFIISKWSTTPTLSKVQAIILILNHRGNRDSRSSACWQMGGFVSIIQTSISYLMFADTN